MTRKTTKISSKKKLIDVHDDLHIELRKYATQNKLTIGGAYDKAIDFFIKNNINH